MNKQNLFQKLTQKILDECYPQLFKCVFCAKEVFDSSNTCPECLESLPRNNKKTCQRCGTPLHTLANYCYHCKEMPFAFKKALSPFVYESPISNAIKNLKYSNAQYFVKALAPFVADCYLQSNFCCDCIVPVPLHIKRLKERGFNQSDLLAKELSNILQIPTELQVVKRITETPTQTHFNRKQREENLKNAFVVSNKKAIKGKNVLLVDDVFTTGATLDHCSSALCNAGAQNVYCLTIAHSDFSKQKTKKV